jgi:hypothetical protein
MKKLLFGFSIGFLLWLVILNHQEASPIIGTWQLISGTTIKGSDTTVTDYTKGQEMIKIITPTHFSFLRHDLNHGKDSTADYSAGGGRVKIEGKKYKEYLDYFNVREWEGGEFEFDYEVTGDTLIIKGRKGRKTWYQPYQYRKIP